MHGSQCRLTGDDREAMLDGSPDALRGLADLLDRPDDTIAVRFATGGQLRRVRTTDDRLRISVEPGSVLVAEGSASAIDLLTHILRGLADEADEADEVGHAAIHRHAHIEYLGPDDRWRAPDSTPLVVSSDWPSTD